MLATPSTTAEISVVDCAACIEFMVSSISRRSHVMH